MMQYWTHSYRAHTLWQATTKAHTIHEEAAPYYEDITHRYRRSPSGRLPLGRTQSLRRLLLSMRIYYNPWAQGAHPSGRLPLGCTQSMRWLLLSTTWGSTWGSGLCCESAESSYLRNPTQTNRPRAPAHCCLYRDLSLTDDWLICLSCDHTWCCHPVVGNIPFAP